MKTARTWWRLATVAIGTAVVLVSWTATASAHEVRAYQGLDWATVGYAHIDVNVYDVECDGHGVWVSLTTRTGAGYGVYDPNGCKTGSGYLRVPSSTIASFQVCESGGGCGEWVRVT